MRRYILAILTACIAWSVSAQDNMVPFRHFSVGAEVGLHGLGVELAMPIHKRIVLKAGYNWTLDKDLLNTDIIIDTREYREYQEEHPLLRFKHMFEDETIIHSGFRLGMNNLKAMINWYPFALGRFYMSGGVYYSINKDDPFIMLSGYTSREDWAALEELRNKTLDLNKEKQLAVEIDGVQYATVERGKRGYIEADYITSQLKYYVGMGLGRCVPNKTIGLQMEVGAMIYSNAKLYCQDKEIGSIREAAVAFGEDTREVLEYMDKYPVYPQLTMRLSFRAL